jgi:DMATS type aromatic prenyltransferase
LSFELRFGGFLANSAPLPSRAASAQGSVAEPATSATYAQICAADLRALSSALYGIDDGPEPSLSLATELLAGWGDSPVPARAPYPSRIGDDHSPFEYSVAFSAAGNELRLLFEAQAPQPSDAGNREAALALNRQLASRSGVHMGRFETVESLFLQSGGEQEFWLWHAVVLNRGAPPSFKLYLNPQVRGAENSWDLLSEAVTRLKLPSSTMEHVRLALRRPGLDQLSYFSLDLSDSQKARVKIYVAHHGIGPSELDDIFRLCPSHHPGDVIEFCGSIAGVRPAFERKPLMSCLAFTSGLEAPTSMTLHLPIAHYVPNDEVAVARVRSFLAGHDLDADAYQAAVSAILRRPLSSGRGAQSYASFRREYGSLRLTAYLSPELFMPLPPRKAGPSWRPTR